MAGDISLCEIKFHAQDAANSALVAYWAGPDAYHKAAMVESLRKAARIAGFDLTPIVEDADGAPVMPEVEGVAV